MTRSRPSPPRATYRIQLHAGFTLHDAADLVPYLARLGVSHLYASPILQAAAGSTHGYDVVDHGRVNVDLGGEPGLDHLSDALDAHGMGLILDIVPNHMAIAEENRWWWDVLEHGQASRFARWFDVDWDPPESRLRNVILLPVLADHYGRVLEAGEIGLVRDGSRIVVTHGDRRFPVDPRTLGPIVVAAGEHSRSDELAFIGAALSDLPPSTSQDSDAVARRQRDAEVLGSRLGELLEDRALGHAVDQAVAAVAGDVDRLDAFLDDQQYRLALWRAAARDLGYRRFFDIDELIGLRMEDPEVFAETHRLVLEWVGEGRVHGLRIDHPDGLRDPAGYFARLRDAAPNAWIVAEKILEADEPLPSEWPIDGTTGYRFGNLATGIVVDRSGEPTFDEIWAAAADVGPEWESIAEDARAEVLTSVLGSDLNRLTDLFVAVCEANRRFRDYTRHELHDALREVAVRLPVYRTYVTADPRHVSDRDAGLIATATAAATEARTDLDPELFELVGAVLRLEVPGPLATELALRFQQLTPAAMAKGVEDTAFYRHHRLTALNEVGGDPSRFGIGTDAFHHAMASLHASWPSAMLALSTHDTKRSADLRARIALLTQDAQAWRAAVNRFMRASRRHRAARQLPTDADAYLVLQTLIGAWPIEEDRAVAYLEKASREAKLRTSWTSPDEAYDTALAAFVRGCLADERVRRIVERQVAALRDAWHRAVLAQQALQLLAPGVPDLYQGTEVPDLSLVDPDNRRPVDYGRRQQLLDDVAAMSAVDAWARRDDGAAKVWLVARLLDLRRRRPEAFRPGGEYRPLAVTGTDADVAVGFVRAGAVITIVPRLADPRRWTGATVDLPSGTWCGLDGTPRRGQIALVDLFDAIPVAVLERQ